MNASFSRRRMIQALGAAAAPAAMSSPAAGDGMRDEGRDTPKLCMNISEAGLTDAGMRRIKQLGVNYVLMTGSADSVGGIRHPLPYGTSESRDSRLRT